MCLVPKISIVTPSYNQGEYLEETILSVLGQKYPNLEYIIMDGGSTDNSVEIIKKYSADFAYWISEKDGGQAAAINSGFKLATGDILMWLNSDDILMPNVLAYIADMVAKHGDNLYLGECIHFKKKDDGSMHASGSNVANAHKLLKLEEVDYVIQPATFWTKKVWQKTGQLNENMNFGFDWEWFLRVKNGGFNFICTHKCLAMYRFHDGHKSGSGGNKRQHEFLAIYEKFCPDKAVLYALLMEHKKKQFSFIFSLFKVYYVLIGKPLPFNVLLKKIYPKTYAPYSADEIDLLIKML